MDLLNLLVWLVVLVVSAIPLNIAVKLLGGKSSILMVIWANLIYFLIVFLIKDILGWGDMPTFVSFILMLFVYKKMFSMGWLRTLAAWLLQFVLLILFGLLILILGLL